VDDPAVNVDMYKRIGALYEWTDRLPWSEEQWRRWLAGCETYLVELDGEPAGYFELRNEGRTALIAIFGLLEEFRGRGVGGHALATAVERGFALAPAVRVTTNSLDSEHALDNYLARGFRITHTENRPAT